MPDRKMIRDNVSTVLGADVCESNADLYGQFTVTEAPSLSLMDQFTSDQLALVAVWHDVHGDCDYLCYFLASGWVELHCPSCDAFRVYPPLIDLERGGE